jgi:hypothetical protein
LPCLTTPPSSICRPGQRNPVENPWTWLRANQLAIAVSDTCDDIDYIDDARCNARNFFANDPKAIAPIASRDRAEVS